MGKEKWITFRVDENLWKAIDRERKKYKNRSEFLRALAEGFYPMEKQKKVMAELEKFRLEINKIGTNINQITKNNNSQLYFQRDKERLEKSMKQILVLENELIDRMGSL